MFDEGTNAVTMNLPQQVENHRVEMAKQLNTKHAAYDEETMSSNLIENELKIFTGSSEETGKNPIFIQWIWLDNVDLIKETHEIYEPQIRDYSIDTWNGIAGLDYWGYSSDENDASK